MMTSNPYTTTWRCPCDKEYSLIHKKCKDCGNVISSDMLEKIYREEISQQNIDYADEEKRRKIIILLIIGISLINAPIIIGVIIWMLLLSLFLVGASTGTICIVDEYKLAKNRLSIISVKRKWFMFSISVICYLLLGLAFASWVNSTIVIIGTMALSWSIFVIVYSIRAAKMKSFKLERVDIVGCGIKVVVLVLMLVKIMMKN